MRKKIGNLRKEYKIIRSIKEIKVNKLLKHRILAIFFKKMKIKLHQKLSTFRKR